jgi:hypothetical protein
MDVGIADMVAHVELLMLEQVLLIYPEWQMEETQYANERDKQTSTSNKENEWPALIQPTPKLLVRNMINEYYKIEHQKLSAQFPNLHITICKLHCIE